MGDNAPSVGDTTNNTMVTYDVSHPYHLNPSDSPGMNLIHSIFDGRGFPGWRRSIFIALSAKKKLGFINGCIKAPEPTSRDYEQWSCVNDMIIAWLLNALSLDIRDSVIYSKIAKELWDSLEQRFGKLDGAKLYQLQKELSTVVQGNNNIAGYFTKLKRIWDELDSLNPVSHCTCVCVCDGKAKLIKSLEDQKLIHFLMGLNDAYTQARSTIIMMNPLPSMDVAYSLLLQDENQREASVTTFSNPADSGSFMVSGKMRGNYKPGNQLNKGGNSFHFNGHSAANPTRGGVSQRFKQRRAKYNSNVSCTYCKKTGHVHDDCFRLHGFLEDFEFTKSKEYGHNIRGNAVIGNEEAEDMSPTPTAQSSQFTTNQGNQFSKEQYNEIVQQVLKEMKLCQSSTSGSALNANAMAGTILKYSGSCFAVYNTSTWIIDSGASEHMCFNPNSFLTLKPLSTPLNISLPNSFRIYVTHIGSVSVHPNLTLNNVLLVPEFKYNLLSVHRLCVQLQCDLLFTLTGCVLQDPSLRKEQVFGEVGDGLYLLKPTKLESSQVKEAFSIQKGGNSIVPREVVSVSKAVATNIVPSPILVSNTECKNSSVGVHANTISNVRLWHIRLGHLPFPAMKSLSVMTRIFHIRTIWG
ncbi:uncharacterized protein LOC129884063 [Solanum dulcamara]|uniref:uncharacterized protein LOC129884063 n=1 Tax=Solanum dulcamara TaxID=45834 RepID=UPI002485FCB4|nr:uncharacterized protein LOC129884063 [Solanum dulcamara]